VFGCSSTSSSWTSSSCERFRVVDLADLSGLFDLPGLFDVLDLLAWLTLAALPVLLALLALLVLLPLVTAGFATRELAACEVRLPGGLPLRFCAPSLLARFGAYTESVNMFWSRRCVGFTLP
jgi:hypothetical protein